VARTALFLIGAIVGAVASYALADFLVPDIDTPRPAAVLILGTAVFAGLWLATGGRLRLSVRSRQVQRRTAMERPYRGALSFGFLLGLGWWTLVVTPLFWVSLALASVSGSGAAAGLAFAVGRTVPAAYGAAVDANTLNPDRVTWALAIQAPRAWRAVAAAYAGVGAFAATALMSRAMW